MELFSVNDELYAANCDPRVRTFVNQGGTSSGKTYCLMQRLIELSIINPRSVVTIAGQDLPNLKVGAMRDTETIIGDNQWLQDWFIFNRSGNYLRGKNGGLVEFKSYADAQDAKNGKRDYLFVNEANGVPFEIYWQLAIRTRKQIFIDYNPTARFWVHDEIIGRPDTRLIISDHRGNRFLTESEHKRIEGIADPELWKVYARGLTGKITGLVLTRWDIVDGLPPRAEWKMSAWGMDFGFTNDPTALEHVVLAHGELWVDEEFYETGMTNPEIAKRAKDAGLGRGDIIIADSAEPKSIHEIKNMGLWVVPSVKGADSVAVGLDILRRYVIHFTRRSQGIIGNAKSYQWKRDRDGKNTNDPQDGNDHGIDAIRYVALMKLNQRRQTGGSRAKVMSF